MMSADPRGYKFEVNRIDEDDGTYSVEVRVLGCPTIALANQMARKFLALMSGDPKATIVDVSPELGGGGNTH